MNVGKWQLSFVEEDHYGNIKSLSIEMPIKSFTPRCYVVYKDYELCARFSLTLALMQIFS